LIWEPETRYRVSGSPILMPNFKLLTSSLSIKIQFLDPPAQVAGREGQAEKIGRVRHAEIIDLVVALALAVDHIDLVDTVGFASPKKKLRHHFVAVKIDGHLDCLV
jgi:hypothetical protein